MKSSNVNPRPSAARALVRVVDKNQTLDSALNAIVTPDASALVQEMIYGVLRWYHRLDTLAEMLLKQNLKKKDRDIHMLLLIGLYELIYMKTDDYAAVNETVSAASKLGKTWAKGLLNACLRRAQRESNSLQQRLESCDSSHYSHPQWFVDLLREQYPLHWQQILRAANERPPMHLRVNTNLILRDDYLALLAENGLAAHMLDISSAGISLEKPVNVNRLPGFDSGQVSVQDGAAQLAARLLDIQPGQRILDACAAPGGKAAHILESHPDIGALLLVEKSARRMQRINENFERLGLAASIKIGDASRPDDWWDGKPFQRILLDAPCSATGVIRRHPDIKLHRDPQQITQASRIQGQILEALWSLLEADGKLLYATCSVLAAENQELVAGFLAKHVDAQEVALDLAWAQQRFPGYQILPGSKGVDGFYYACLQKT
ncbi:MAG: 16S rRNA (cytosine(967)-C(5))-methyltransferase RsmB [Acidiferrobacterales bacterium]